MGSLEWTHSFSGAAFLEITCRFTSLVGCLQDQGHKMRIPAVSTVPVGISLLKEHARSSHIEDICRYLKYSRENSFKVAGANLCIVPVSFSVSCMMFFLWLGDKLMRL